MTARQRWLLFSAQIGGIRLLDVVVGTAASVGNILTSAEGDADIRFGVNHIRGGVLSAEVRSRSSVPSASAGRPSHETFSSTGTRFARTAAYLAFRG